MEIIYNAVRSMKEFVPHRAWLELLLSGVTGFVQRECLGTGAGGQGSFWGKNTQVC